MPETKNKRDRCPGCGCETYPQAPACDCGRGWWREPSFDRWPVQVPYLVEPEELDDTLPF